MQTRLRVTLITAVGALVVTVLVYGRTLSYGLFYDDYHFVHRYRLSEVANAFVASWDTSGLELPYYRPLTIALFAGRSWIVGSNPVSLHAISLLLAAVAAWLLIQWCLALDLSLPAAISSALVLLMHPVFSESAVGWITNQMHLAELILMLGALWLATSHPDRWKWVLCLQVAALLVKEDAIMLGPALAMFWLLQRQRLQRGWVISSMSATALYVLVRTLAVGTHIHKAIARPSLWIGNFIQGPQQVFFVDDTAGLCAVLALGLLARRRERWLLPFVLGIVFGLPLMLVTGSNRWHLLVLCLALLIALMVDGSAFRLLAIVSTLALLTRLLVLNVTTTAELAPCSSDVRDIDRTIVAAWQPVLDAEARAQFQAKEELCGSLASVPR